MIRLTFILLFALSFILNSEAQDFRRIGFVGIDQNRMRSGTRLNRILKNNSIQMDTLITHINSKLIQNHDNHIQVVDITATEFGKQFSEMEYEYAVTSTYKKYQSSKNNLNRIKSKNINAVSNQYFSVKLSPEVKESLKLFMGKENLDYLVLIDRFTVYKNHLVGEETDMILHFEIFNDEMIKVLGDKIERRLRLSSKVYYSTFNYYLDNIFDDYKLKMKEYYNK